MTNTNHIYIDLPMDKESKKKLKGHLRQFFSVLDSTPKPSKEKVRTEFIRHEADWRLHCALHCLGTRIAGLFNAYVSQAWESRYRKESQ